VQVRRISKSLWLQLTKERAGKHRKIAQLKNELFFCRHWATNKWQKLHNVEEVAFSLLTRTCHCTWGGTAESMAEVGRDPWRSPCPTSLLKQACPGECILDEAGDRSQ